MFGLGNRRDRDLQKVLDRLDTIERTIKSLRMEWEEVSDKVYRWMKRSQKRDRDEGGAETNGSPDPAGQHPAVSRIWQRRRARGLPSGVPTQE